MSNKNSPVGGKEAPYFVHPSDLKALLAKMRTVKRSDGHWVLSVYNGDWGPYANKAEAEQILANAKQRLQEDPRIAHPDYGAEYRATNLVPTGNPMKPFAPCTIKLKLGKK